MTAHSRAVFLSYASEDTEAAQRIADALKAAGLEVWFDKSELRGGDAWDQAIRQRIRECKLFIPVISANTEARAEGYFRREWKLASDRTDDMSGDVTFLMPVSIDATPEVASRVPPKFREVQWTRLPGGTADAAFVTRVAGLLDDRAGSATTPSAIGTQLPATRRLPVRWRLAALAACAVLLSGGWYAWRGRSVRPVTEASTPDRSIAVLPLVDMSEKHDQEYLADGISEELINRLAQWRDLRVTARTSAFHFKGRNDDIRSIARALGVAHVLEGSIRRSGDHLRVTAQLIRAETGIHLWSQAYDIDFKKIFDVQDEVAIKVAQLLHSSMDALPVRLDRPNTMEAYDLTLQAQGYSEYTVESFRRRIELLRLAVSKDPEYAYAWARLAAMLGLSTQLITGDSSTVTREALEAADRALQLAPDLPSAYSAKAFAYMYAGQLMASESEFRKASELQPGLGDRMLAFWAAERSGDPQPLIAYLQSESTRDPFFATIWSNLSLALLYAGECRESETAARRLLRVEPGFDGAHWQLALALICQGRTPAALQAVELDKDEGNRLYIKAMAYWSVGRRREADAALAEVQRLSSVDCRTDVADIRAFRHEPDLAFAELERSSTQCLKANHIVVALSPYLKPYRSDTRFGRILEILELAPRRVH